jgi:hypothetical protein
MKSKLCIYFMHYLKYLMIHGNDDTGMFSTRSKPEDVVLYCHPGDMIDRSTD